MFPSGLPGIALLLLRLSVALTVFLHGYACREELTVVFLAGFLLLTMSLIVGFLTPIVALLAMAVQFAGPWDPCTSSTGHVIELGLNALALTLLGPGAYSFDARRFGRRVVNLSSDD